MATQAELEELLARAQDELREAQARLPAHSVRPWQLENLERAEEKVAELKRKIAELMTTEPDT